MSSEPKQLAFMIFTNVVLFLTIPRVSSINYYIGQWPTIRGQTGTGTISTFLWQNFETSLEVCREFFEPWWVEYEVLRRSADISLLLGKFGAELPPVPVYNRSPVQAIKAERGGRTYKIKEGASRGPRMRGCKFTCEDQRSDVELWLTKAISSFQQNRYKSSFAMRCQPNFSPEIEWIPDERDFTDNEVVSAASKLIQQFDDTYKGRTTYREASNRTLYPGLVSICRCVDQIAKPKADPKDDVIEVEQYFMEDAHAIDLNKEWRPDDAAAEERGDGKDADVDMTNDERAEVHPWEEGAYELAQAYRLWMTVSPWSGIEATKHA